MIEQCQNICIHAKDTSIQKNMGNGIAIAGNILTDQIKEIEYYPHIGMLANITATSRAVGGCVPNTAINLAKIDPKIPIAAIGCVGNDEQGQYLLAQLQKQGIHTEQINILEGSPTSFTDVMSLPAGERTFFHARGANARFSPETIDLEQLDCQLLHIGYLLLLDAFDAPDNTYGTVMAHFLHDVQEKGIKTSIDMVSDSTADYQNIVVPALRYCDYVIINEIECCSTAGLESRTPDGTLHIENIRTAMEQMIAHGVRNKVIVHSKEAGFCLNAASGVFTAVPSLQIPPEEIKGSVGAGDSYCAGCLYGLYHGLNDEELLRFASAAAACNLFAANSVDGMRSSEEIKKMESVYERMEWKIS